MKPETYFFKDDGEIPNSKYPLLIYRAAFNLAGDEGAEWLETHFERNDWKNSWRNGVYDFHHYHSISHEVLGVYSGRALLQLGGKQGAKINVSAGDIIVIPAGVGHKNLGSESLGIVGAYPGGRHWDVKKGLPGERPETDRNIAAVPKPNADPLLGMDGGLITYW